MKPGLVNHPMELPLETGETLEKGRDAVRALKAKDGLPPGGVVVRLRGGEHPLEQGVCFGPEDSGTADAPVVYCSAPGETVRLLGGRRLDPDAFAPVGDAAVLARLTEPARAAVLQLDLRSHGVSDFGVFTSRGFARESAPAHLELFFNNLPMTVAQWPNAGEFVNITGYSEPINDEWSKKAGKLTGSFTYEGDRPLRWAPSDDIWVHGYWAYDWANSYERVAQIDPHARTVKTAAPHGCYHFAKGQRFYFLNVLEELDQPGEYYLDRGSGILYFWPPEPMDGAEIIVSVLDEPLLTFKQASHIELRGLTVEAGRDSCIEAEGGEGLRVSGCTLRNCGTWAAKFSGGSAHAVSGCEIHGTGDGGIMLSGGDRKTLEPCNHSVVNCRIHDFSRWSRCYVPAVLAQGVGMRIANNRIHDAPHTAILFNGNEFLIENNEIFRVCLETGDAGAIYTGRDYTYRGNTVRRNFIHHMGGMGEIGSMAIYMDDCVSGTRIVENIMWKCQSGVHLGSGRDFIVANNIFVECSPAIRADARGIDTKRVWQDMVKVFMKERLEAMRHHEPPYSTRYPELRDLDRHYAAGKGVPPENNRVERNICWRCEKWISDCWPEGADNGIMEQNNLVEIDPLFTDPDAGDFSLRPGSPALDLGFRPIPREKIGVIGE